MSDSSIGQQGLGSKMCGIEAFLVSESNYIGDVCFCPAPMLLFDSEHSR